MCANTTRQMALTSCWISAVNRLHSSYTVGTTAYLDVKIAVRGCRLAVLMRNNGVHMVVVFGGKVARVTRNQNTHSLSLNFVLLYRAWSLALPVCCWPGSFSHSLRAKARSARIETTRIKIFTHALFYLKLPYLIPSIYLRNIIYCIIHIIIFIQQLIT